MLFASEAPDEWLKPAILGQLVLQVMESPNIRNRGMD
jgi:hypothetical protein